LPGGTRPSNLTIQGTTANTQYGALVSFGGTEIDVNLQTTSCLRSISIIGVDELNGTFVSMNTIAADILLRPEYGGNISNVTLNMTQTNPNLPMAVICPDYTNASIIQNITVTGTATGTVNQAFLMQDTGAAGTQILNFDLSGYTISNIPYGSVTISPFSACVIDGFKMPSIINGNTNGGGNIVSIDMTNGTFNNLEFGKTISYGGAADWVRLVSITNGATGSITGLKILSTAVFDRKLSLDDCVVLSPVCNGVTISNSASRPSGGNIVPNGATNVTFV
jgi:hypothetical protein